MRLFQQNLEDLSSRISAAEAIKNSWQSPSDIAEVGEMLEQLQVQPDASLMQRPNIIVEWVAKMLCILVSGYKLCIMTGILGFRECLQSSDDVVLTLKRPKQFHIVF
jgi:hypothetical protein